MVKSARNELQLHNMLKAKENSNNFVISNYYKSYSTNYHIVCKIVTVTHATLLTRVTVQKQKKKTR